MKRFIIYLACGAISAVFVTLMLRNVLPSLWIIVIVAVLSVLLGEFIRKAVK